MTEIQTIEMHYGSAQSKKIMAVLRGEQPIKTLAARVKNRSPHEFSEDTLRKLASMTSTEQAEWLANPQVTSLIDQYTNHLIAQILAVRNSSAGHFCSEKALEPDGDDTDEIFASCHPSVFDDPFGGGGWSLFD